MTTKCLSKIPCNPCQLPENLIRRKYITEKDIIAAVSMATMVSYDQMKTRSRKEAIREARQIAMWLLRKELSLGYRHIGQLFGGRDHTTSMHSFRRIESMRRRDDIVRAKISRINLT